MKKTFVSPLGLFTDQNDRFSNPFIYLKPEKDIPFEWCHFPYKPSYVIGSTFRGVEAP